MTRAILVLLAAAGALEAGSTVDFPMAEGTQWRYEGRLSRRNVGEPVMLRAEMTGVVRRQYLEAGLLRGCPLNLLNSRLGSGICTVVKVGGDRVYMVPEARAAQVMLRIRDLKDELVGLLSEGELLLEGHLVTGKRIGETSQLTRQCEGEPCEYSWVVTAAERPGAGGFLPPGVQSAREFELTWKGLTGRQTVRIVRGVGIVRFAANHGVSGASVDVQLREFRPR